MAYNTIEEMWKILKYNNFESGDETIDEVKCLMCRRIMINASSGPCGCLYCLNCIKMHLNEKESFCPGFTNDCKTKLLNFDCDIMIDRSTNIKISKIIVKCPAKNCDFTDELRKIENHMTRCNIGFLTCPFISVGCNQLIMSNENMDKHIVNEITEHSKFLIESNNNLSKEVESMKKFIMEFQNEINFLKILRDKDQTELAKIQANENRLTEEIINLKNDNNSMKLEIKLSKEKEDKNQVCIKNLKAKLQKVKEENTRELKSTRNEINAMRRNAKNKSIANKQSENLWYQSELLYYPLKDVMLGPRHESSKSSSQISQNATFEWKIDQFLKKLNEAKLDSQKFIDSQPFYSHLYGYQMRLRLFANGFGNGAKTHLSVYFAIIEGENDDFLQWPMENTVTISIIDQISRNIHTSHDYSLKSADNHKEVFQNPSTRRNSDYYHGTECFININSVINNGKLFKNNKIILNCHVR